LPGLKRRPRFRRRLPPNPANLSKPWRFDERDL
jgi:hypothetical protein